MGRESIRRPNMTPVAVTSSEKHPEIANLRLLQMAEVLHFFKKEQEDVPGWGILLFVLRVRKIGRGGFRPLVFRVRSP